MNKLNKLIVKKITRELTGAFVFAPTNFGTKKRGKKYNGELMKI